MVLIEHKPSTKGDVRQTRTAYVPARMRRLPKALYFDLDAFYDLRQTLLLKSACLIAGLLVYFALPNEPYFPALVVLSFFSWVLVLKLPTVGYARFLGHFWLTFTLGLLLGSAHILFAETPMLSKSHEGVIVRGWVEKSELRDSGATRLTVGITSTSPSSLGLSGAHIRLSTRAKFLPQVGDLIRTRATLIPPPDPLAPGAYDPAIRYYFDGISANGFTTGNIVVQPDEPMSLMLHIKTFWHKVRQGVSERLRRSVSEMGGALITALIVGDRSHLDQTQKENFRAAGIAHILSISGLHMVLIAGTLFWIVRAGLALSTTLALRYNIKAWAAIAGFLGATLYLTVSGGAVPTFRAWVMVTIGFAAILANRRALSLRNVVIAALIIIGLDPQQILQPGFQMTFAATMALIVFYERYRSKPFEPAPLWWLRAYYAFGRYAVGIITTTLVASLATMPIAAYHFGAVTVVGLLGNMLVLPLFGFIVMPCAVVALLLLPFGLEILALMPMDWGANLIIEMANFVTSLPGARLLLPSFSGLSIALLFLAGLMVICLAHKWRWLSGLPLIAGLMVMIFVDLPDILVSPSAKTVLVRNPENGRIDMSYLGRGEQFLRKRWLQMLGDGREWRDAGKASNFVCEDNLCRMVLPSGEVVIHDITPPLRKAAQDNNVLAENSEGYDLLCDEASVIISLKPVICPHSVLTFSPYNMERGIIALKHNNEGGDSVWQRLDTITNTHRPWNAYRAR